MSMPRRSDGWRANRLPLHRESKLRSCSRMDFQSEKSQPRSISARLRRGDFGYGRSVKACFRRAKATTETGRMVTIPHRGLPPIRFRPSRAKVQQCSNPDLRAKVLSLSRHP